MFASSVGDWTYLAEFWKTVFWPWLVGGVPLGLVAGFIAYYLSVPTIRAYKNRRKRRVAAWHFQQNIAKKMVFILRNLGVIHIQKSILTVFAKNLTSLYPIFQKLILEKNKEDF